MFAFYMRYIAKTLPTFGAKLTTPVVYLIVDVNDAPDRIVNGNWSIGFINSIEIQNIFQNKRKENEINNLKIVHLTRDIIKLGDQWKLEKKMCSLGKHNPFCMDTCNPYDPFLPLTEWSYIFIWLRYSFTKSNQIWSRDHSIIMTSQW